MGLLGKIGQNPEAANLMLMGLGLLGSKRRSQASPYIQGISSGLLGMAKGRREDREAAERKRLRDLQIREAQGKLDAPGQVKDLIGQPESAFEADLFPGEAPIPGLRNEGRGLLGGKLTPQQFATSLLSVPGYEQVGSSLLGKSLEGKGAYIGPDGTQWKDFDQYQKARQSAQKQASPYADQLAEMRGNFESLVSSAQTTGEEGRGAADTAMIFAFAKMLDPRSVVRGEEGETIQRSDGIFGQLQGFLQDIQGKGKLTPSARRGLVLEAHRQLQTKGMPIYQQFNYVNSSASPMFGPLANKDVLSFPDWVEGYEFPTYYGEDPPVEDGPPVANPEEADSWLGKWFN